MCFYIALVIRSVIAAILGAVLIAFPRAMLSMFTLTEIGGGLRVPEAVYTAEINEPFILAISNACVVGVLIRNLKIPIFVYIVATIVGLFMGPIAATILNKPLMVLANWSITAQYAIRLLVETLFCTAISWVSCIIYKNSVVLRL